ncbi:MAG: hypothetical protein JWM78_3697 [Verrucomicrobiaceae bacterium]|nr:hypothetical protein [Verrucomicrobiaceae bacterium]
MLNEFLRHSAALMQQTPAAHVLIADGVFLLAFIAIAKKLNRFMPIYIAFILPGTIAHELAHWSIAVATNGKPISPFSSPDAPRTD